MKYTYKINKKTGNGEWFDEDGKRRRFRSNLKPGQPFSQRVGQRGWPMECEASGCHPSQVQEFQKMMADGGVPTDFTDDGRAIYRDRSHRAKALRLRGIFDKDAGYSDPTAT